MIALLWKVWEIASFKVVVEWSACSSRCLALYVEDIFAEFCMLSLNLVFVPFCEFFVGERTPDLTTIKGNGFYNRVKYFKPNPNWYVEFYVPFDGIEGPSCLVSQIVQIFVEVTCGADV